MVSVLSKRELTAQEIVHAVASRGTQVATRLPGGGAVRWRLWGSGPALVLLHGGHGSWMHWIRNIEPLAERFTVLVPDLPGFGDTDLPAEPLTVDGVAQVLSSGIDEILGTDGLSSVAGFSFGSVVAGHLASLRQHRVRHLVLVGCGRLATPPAPRPEMANWRNATGIEERAAVHRQNLLTLMLHDPERCDELAVCVQFHNTASARVRSPDIVKTHTLHRCLDTCTAPLDAIWGTQDVMLTGDIANAEQMLRKFDAAAVCVGIPGAGHWVQFEAPEHFNRTLFELLDNPRARIPVARGLGR
jgi:2-hydroxy-6-oxonona-2,4-dienedioate hydrolase